MNSITSRLCKLKLDERSVSSASWSEDEKSATKLEVGASGWNLNIALFTHAASSEVNLYLSICRGWSTRCGRQSKIALVGTVSLSESAILQQKTQVCSWGQIFRASATLAWVVYLNFILYFDKELLVQLAGGDKLWHIWRMTSST